MALRFARMGAEVLLAAKMTKESRKALPETIKVATTSVIEKDDIHLILEYKRNEAWGHLSSPRANRYVQ